MLAGGSVTALTQGRDRTARRGVIFRQGTGPLRNPGLPDGFAAGQP